MSSSARIRRWWRRSRSAMAPISARAASSPRTCRPDALALGRGRQVNKPGYAPKIRARAEGVQGDQGPRGRPDMCGIVGIIGTEPVAPRLVDALKRLEYRGYDSAGRRDARGRRHRPPPRRGQARQSRTEARASSRWAARSASATRAGRRMARRPSAMPTRTPPTRSRWSTTASSRTSASCSRTSPRTAICRKTRDRHGVGGALGHARARPRAVAGSGGRRRRCKRLRGAFALVFLFQRRAGHC